MENTMLWDKLAETPASAKSEYKTLDGTTLTAVDPIYRALKLTEVFGPCGVGWGWEVTREWVEDRNNIHYTFAKVKVWYRWNDEMCMTGEQVGGFGGGDPSEAYKSAVTDGIGKCFSMIGLAADVYGSQPADAPQVPSGDLFTRGLEKACKLRDEGNQEAIRNAQESVRRSPVYTETQKRTLIETLAQGVSGGSA